MLTTLVSVGNITHVDDANGELRMSLWNALTSISFSLLTDTRERVGGGFVMLIQHCMAEWSEGNDVLVFTDEISSSSSLDMMRSSVCPLLCVGQLTTFLRFQASSISANFTASVFDLSLTCKLKSPTIRSF